VLIAAYPGSFNPPTVAHLAIAEAAVIQLGIDRLDLVISVDPLGKDAAGQVRVHDRLAVLEAIAADRPWLAVRTTELRLIADIAAGYDAVVVGADKWAQVLDPAWYDGSTEARDRAVATLRVVALAPRSLDGEPIVTPNLGRPGVTVVPLDVHPSHHRVSATSVRSGRRDWMADEAAAFDERSGAWSDPARYARWVAADPGPPEGDGSEDEPAPDGPGQRGIA
jgi:hypothetical protein